MIIYMILFVIQSLGNHEFDDGVDGLVPFVEAANHPVIPVFNMSPLILNHYFSTLNKKKGDSG